LLREAGLDANPVLVSTRSNGIPIFPTRNGYNYVISAVSFDQGLVLLDATEKAGTPNILPVRALNWNGRLIKKEGQNLEISLTPNKKAMSNYNLMVKIDDVGDLTGKYRATYKSHRAMSFRKSYSSSNEEEYIRELEKNQGDIEIENYKQTNFQNVYKPVMESYEFVWEEFMTGEGDKMYISPMLFFRTKENPFKLDERSYPIDFVYPEQKKYRILFQIPEGYQVESVPEPMYLKLPDNIGAYKYNLVAKGNSLQLNASFDINVPIIGSDYYGALKEMFAGIIKKEGEKVILSKK
jgi:hypothetical protein